MLCFMHVIHLFASQDTRARAPPTCEGTTKAEAPPTSKEATLAVAAMSDILAPAIFAYV